MNDDYLALYIDAQRRANALRAEEARRIARSMRDRMTCTAERLAAWINHRPARRCGPANSTPLPHT